MRDNDPLSMRPQSRRLANVEVRARRAVKIDYVTSSMETNLPSSKREEFSRRILTIQDGEVRPLYAADPVGVPAPSSTLLVERFDLESIQWQTHVTTERLLMLFLKPAIMLASEENMALYKIALSVGQIGFSLGRTTTSVSSHGPVSQLCVRVADSSLMEVSGDLGWNDRLEFKADRVISNDQLVSLLYALEAERRSSYPSGPLFIDGIELAMATLLVKSYGVFPQNLSKDPIQVRKSGSLSLALPPHLLRRVLDRMRDFTGSLNLEALAAETGYSRRHFLRMFQKATGATPHQYLLQSRLKYAQELMRKGNMSLIDIAATCGFSSHAHMSKVFRKLLGVSPSDYRRSR